MRPPRLLIGTSAVCLVFMTYKGVFLADRLAGGVGLALTSMAADCAVFGLITLCAVLPVRFALGRVRWIAYVLGALIGLWYLADLSAIVYTNHRLTLDNALRFTGELDMIASFVSGWHVAAALGVIALVVVARVQIPARLATPLLAASVAFIAVGETAGRIVPRVLRPYPATVSQIFLNIAPIVEDVSPYTSGDRFLYRAPEVPRAQLPGDRVNVILVVVESLSSVDSKAIGGIRDGLPQLERVAADGVLFTNFIANHTFSAGGFVALLQGTPPMPFPGALYSVYRTYKNHPSIVSDLHAKGYRVEALMATKQTGLFFDEWATAIGFDKVGDPLTVESLKNAPRFALGAPSDGALYDEALRHSKELGGAPQPYFLVLAPNSGHTPYVHPEGGPNTAEALTQYVDTQIGRFYDELKRSGFFENGLLLITSDHRHYEPVSSRELEVFGESALARVPLVVVGRGAPAGVVDDRLFQQSDVFAKLDDALKPGTTLTTHAVFVALYNTRSRRLTPDGNLKIFTPESPRKGFSALALGRHFSWVGPAPPGARAIEDFVHSQRLHGQRVLDGQTRTCRVPTVQASATALQGLFVGVAAKGAEPKRWAPTRPQGAEVAVALNADPSQGERDIVLRTFVAIATEGYYSFNVSATHEVCMAIAGEVAIDGLSNRVEMGEEAKRAGLTGFMSGKVFLRPGLHRFDIKLLGTQGPSALFVSWETPDTQTEIRLGEHGDVAAVHLLGYEPMPSAVLRLPDL